MYYCICHSSFPKQIIINETRWIRIFFKMMVIMYFKMLPILKSEERGLFMLYLHDVWVNWFEGEENGYNVCHFHEWRKEDQIQLLDQAPLLYITEALFNYIENDMCDMPNSLLDSIYKRAFMRKGQERNVMEYACIITDGMNILAVDTIG